MSLNAMKLTLRELILLVTLAATALGWWLYASRLSHELQTRLVNVAKANARTEINWVNSRQKICWIDQGSDYGLATGTVFTVFRRDENGTPLHSKARIEVASVSGSKTAECRILDEDLNDPIEPGDNVFCLDR